jgi:hypothetical protein
MGIISNALKSTVTNLTGFAVNTTRAIFGLSVGAKNPKGKNKDIESAYSETLSSSKEVLGLIYEQLQKAREQEIANRINQQKNKNLEEESKIKFYSSLVKALTIRQRIKPKTLNPVKPKVVKKKKTPEELAADATKRVEDVKAPTKPSGTPTQPTQPSGTPTQPAGTKPSAEKIPKVEPVPVTPTPTTPSTTRIPPAEVSTGTGKAARIITGGVAAGGLLAVTRAIAKTESGLNYDISFGDKYDKTSKKWYNAATDPITKKPLGLKTPEEWSGGKKLTEMTLEEVQAFGKYRSENGAGAGAVGAYQFMPNTLFGGQRKDSQGKWYFAPGLVQRSGHNMADKFTPDVQDKLAQLLRQDDLSQLKRLGVPLTPGYQYMAHYLGAGGAAAVYNNRDKDMTIAQAMATKGYAVGNNRELYEKKTKDFEQILTERLVNKGGLLLETSTSSQIPSKNTTGTTVNDMSNSNSNIKEDLVKKASDTAAKGAMVTIMDASKSAEETNNTIRLGSDESALHQKTSQGK